MNKEQVLSIFKILARSQGSYGRLLERIGYEGENGCDEFFDMFKNCKDAVDIVLTIEG